MKRHLILAIAAILLFSQNFAQEVVESGKYAFTSEAELATPQKQQEILDFYNKGIEGTLPGAKNIKIYYRVFLQLEKEKGAIVLSTGRTEGAVKYMETVYDLYNNGYSVYIHDHRGQGLSGRMTEDPEMGYVDNYQYYVDDMKAFFNQEVKAGNHEKIFLLAHSMGGMIGMNYIQQHPDDFDAAAFSSPMLKLASYICPLAKILSGKTPKYAPGQTGYTNDSTKFEGNDVTHSEVRYHVKIGAYEAAPEARIGGAAVQWLEESCRGMKKAHKNVSLIQIPFIIFTAGEETVVDPAGNGKLVQKAQKLGKECREVPVPNARHELLMEIDPIRMKVMEEILDFFAKAE